MEQGYLHKLLLGTFLCWSGLELSQRPDDLSVIAQVHLSDWTGIPYEKVLLVNCDTYSKMGMKGKTLARDFRSSTGVESNCRIIQYESLITRHSSPVTHHQSRAFSDPPAERGVLIAQEKKKKTPVRQIS